jgi:hypothetical protein
MPQEMFVLFPVFAMVHFSFQCQGIFLYPAPDYKGTGIVWIGSSVGGLSSFVAGRRTSFGLVWSNEGSKLASTFGKRVCVSGAS